MSVRYHNFMGKLGWEMQKRFPGFSADSYLKLQFLTRGKSQKRYIEYFMGKDEVPQPLVVNIETINRCNSTCSFCTANKNAEKRPYKRMEDELFYKIIDQLRDWGYKGHLTLYGNNEPWLDTRIVEFHKYCREQLPDCFIFLSSNGLGTSATGKGQAALRNTIYSSTEQDKDFIFLAFIYLFGYTGSQL